MQNKALWSMVLALTAVQVMNFVVSPETMGTIGKKHLGAEEIRLIVAQHYRQGGEQAAKDFCHTTDPIKQFGYYYSCGVGHVSGSDYTATNIVIIGYSDYETADAAKHRSVAAALKGDILVDREIDKTKI